MNFEPGNAKALHINKVYTLTQIQILFELKKELQKQEDLAPPIRQSLETWAHKMWAIY